MTDNPASGVCRTTTKVMKAAGLVEPKAKKYRLHDFTAPYTETVQLNKKETDFFLQKSVPLYPKVRMYSGYTTADLLLH